jgi:methylase of polypeptide subunit release factors
LDLGCGCGALLLATMIEFLQKQNKNGYHGLVGVGVDLDANALEWARYNANAMMMNANMAKVRTLSCGIPWVEEEQPQQQPPQQRLAFLQADFGSLHTPSIRSTLPSQGFHVILCNPPYLPRKATSTTTTTSTATPTGGRITMEKDRTLYAGDDGNDAYRALASSLSLCDPFLLVPGGVFCVQLPGACSIRRRRLIADTFRRAYSGWDVYEASPDERGIVRCLLVVVNKENVAKEAMV